MPRVAEGLLATDLDSLALSIYDDASEEGLPRDADSAKPLWPEYGGRSVKPGCSGVEPQATFHDDLLIRYCRGGTGIACREFSTIIMDYVNHPSPWSCSSHKLDHPESSPEVQSNSARNRCFGHETKSPPVIPRASLNLPADLVGREEYGVYVSDAMMRLLKSTLCIRETEPKCPIYIYSIKPPYYSGQEKRHYYKIGRPLNIRHNNREKLKKSHQYRANLALLKRTSPTCGKLFMTLLRCELTINNFTALSRDENMCLICYGSHDEWFSISEEAAYQLQIAHKLPGNDLHWGWPYLHALVNKLILLID
ncbi:hypothetical protein L0F63_001849 [Massospora cicadina]|nr:hypothetical protein L0F63_001849 [Massospora cicadina]